MLSRSGISWRHGPHQLAQKFSITTWPLYCARLTSPPVRAPSENGGAGAPGAAASSGSDRSTVAATAAIRILMLASLVQKNTVVPMTAWMLLVSFAVPNRLD